MNLQKKIKKFPKLSQIIKKLRFVDYLIIIIFLIGLLVLFKFLNQKEEWTTITVYNANVPYFKVQSINVGDIEKDPSGKKIAEIKDVQAYEEKDNSTKSIYITLDILAKINSQSKEKEYKNKIIKVGTAMELKLNSGLLNGIIYKLGNNKEETKEYKIVTVKIYNQWPWFADSIKIKDGELDQKGERILEVLEKQVQLSEITVTTANGDTYLRADPRKRDIDLKLKLKVSRFLNDLIFREKVKLLIGNDFDFKVGNTIINSALITSIE